MILYSLITAALLIAAITFYLQRPKFGKSPSGKRLEQIKKSVNYRDGAFQNLNETPQFSEDVNHFSLMKSFFFPDNKRRVPLNTIPSVKTDLHNLAPDENMLVWFGHSSYFMQIDGKKILVDPVLSGSASPFSFIIKAFEGSNPYTPEDIPEIDYLFITHDHWDHTDYKTLVALKSKIGTVICGLGVGEHFEYWGFDKDRIIEKDWNEKVSLSDNFTVYTAPTRHFSGRGFYRNSTLWTSFILKTKSLTMYIGGDSGYDTHFADIGNEYGPFDVVILENGQYNKNWPYIHMHPKEVLLAAKDLGAKRLFPVHSAKFSLSDHSWDEPLSKISELDINNPPRLLTPKIGEPLFLNNEIQPFT